MIVLISLIMSWLMAMAYVYRYRGKARYDSLQQYLRKSWPVFALPNLVLYLFTLHRARGAFVPVHQYPSLAGLAQHWDVMRAEALTMMDEGGFDEARREGSPASYDLGFRTFYKYGWSRFYLHWYGYTHASAQASCPQTLAILSRFPDVRAAMFAVLPPHSILTPHADPLACSLRYHLGLATPNSPNCFINVDGEGRSWRDGEAFIFDETYLHFVRNDSDAPRLILMCDVRRPMYLPGRVFNHAYAWLARALQTPNDSRDRRGAASALFARLTPWLARGRQLRQHNRPLYKSIKWVINLTLLGVLFGGGAAALELLLLLPDTLLQG